MFDPSGERLYTLEEATTYKRQIDKAMQQFLPEFNRRLRNHYPIVDIIYNSMCRPTKNIMICSDSVPADVRFINRIEVSFRAPDIQALLNVDIKLHISTREEYQREASRIAVRLFRLYLAEVKEYFSIEKEARDLIIVTSIGETDDR